MPNPSDGIPRRVVGGEDGTYVGHMGGLGAPMDKPIVYPDPWNAGPHGSASSDSGGGANARVNGAAVANGVLPVPYGRARIQGSIFHYVRSGTRGGTFYIWFCGGPIDSITQLYNAGLPVPLDWSYEVSLGPASPGSSPSYVWDFTQKFPFVCWIRLVVPETNTIDIGPIEAEMKGRTVFDPRENRILQCNDFTTGWASNYTGPTVTPGQADPFCGNNASLLTFTGTENDWYHNLGALPVIPGDYITSTLWVKSPTADAVGFRIESVNQGPPQEQTIQNVVAYNHWTRIEVAHLCTVAGTPTEVISFGFGDYLPAPLLVYCAGIELKAYHGGRCLTTGTARLPVTQWTRNLPLVLLDILTGGPALPGFTSGVPHSAKVPFDPTRVFIATFGDAATICGESFAEDPNIPADDIRWGVDIVFNQVAQNVEVALQRCRAVAPVDVYRQDDLWRCDVETPCGDVELVYDTDTNTYSNDLGWEIPQRADRPAHVRLAFADPDNNWKADAVVFPPLETGNSELDETSISLDASASRRQLYQVAAYSFKVGKMKRWSLKGTPISALAHRYQRVSTEARSQAVTPARECVVVGLGMVEGGLEWTTLLRETVPELFDYEDPGVPGSGGDPQPASVVPPVVQPVCDSSFNVTWQPARVYQPRILYPAGEWSEANVGSWDATKINDDNVATIGGTFVPAANSEILLTLPAAKAIGGVRISTNVNTSPMGGWLIEANGSAVANPYKRENNHDALDADPGYWEEWDVVTATTWKLRKGTGVAGTESIGEIQYREYVGLYPNSAKVKVFSHGTTIQLGPEITASTSGAVTVNLAAFAGKNALNTLATLDIDLVNYDSKGNASIPVRVTKSVSTTPQDAPQKPRMLRVDHATGIAKWQRPIYHYGDDGTTQVRYGGAFWAATNTSAFTAAAVNDGVTNVTAVNPNAAGATDITLSMPGAGVAFAAFQVTFNGVQPVIGFIDQFVLQYRAVAGVGSWITAQSYLATAGTTVSFTPFTQVPTLATHDAYVVSATSVRFEIDWRDIGAPEEWRLHQITSAAINLPIAEIQPLVFLRWNYVGGYVVWAGFYGTGATLTNGAAMNLAGKSPRFVPGGAPSVTEFETQSALFDAGPYLYASADRRRLGYPGVFNDSAGDPDPTILEAGNVLGYLYEVTVKSVDPTGTFESVSRYAWDWLRSTCVGTSL